MIDFEEDDVIEDGKEERVDFMALLSLLWNRKKSVLKVTACFMAVGLFLALFSPQKFESQCVFVPQMSQGLSSKYSSIASMIGIEMSLSSNGTDGQVSPRLYPLILENPHYLKDLMQTRIHVEKAAGPITVYDFYTKKEYQKFNLLAFVSRYTIGLPKTLIGLVRKDKEPFVFTDAAGDPAAAAEVEPVIRLTKEEDAVARIILKSIKIEVDAKKGYLILSATMPEAQASTELCQSAYRLLQEYVRDFKKVKSEANLAFISSERAAARTDYENAQIALAKFTDANFGIEKAVAKIQKIRLQSDYELAKQVFSELSKQELSAKVRVNEETIAFTELAPPSVPLKRSSPKRAAMMVVWTFLGVIGGCVFVIGKEKYTSWKRSKEV